MAIANIIRSVLACALLVGSAMHNESKAGPPNVTVSVRGSGPTVDDAKADAVRQALQLTLKQLVVVDRAISGDRLLRDKVMSTVNGYVERYQQQSISATGGQYQVDAEITVSASRIENFIGTIIGSAGTIQGQTLLDEQNRRKAQALAEQQQIKARGEIFDRLLVGFPTSHLDVRIKDMRVSPNDANIIDVSVEVSWKRTFALAMERTVEALSSCRWTGPRREGNVLSVWGNHINLRLKNSCEDLQITSDIIYRAYVLPGAARNFGKEKHISCFYDAIQARCYMLESGDYCRSCGVGSVVSDMVILGRFIDSQGQSANLKSPCVSANVYTVGRQRSRAEIPAYIANGGGTIEARFDTLPIEGSFHVDSHIVDLARAKRFIAIAAAGDAKSGRWLISLNAEMRPLSCEQLLDEAIQRYMITAR